MFHIWIVLFLLLLPSYAEDEKERSLIQLELRRSTDFKHSYIQKADQHYDNGRNYHHEMKYDMAAREFALAIEKIQKYPPDKILNQDQLNAYRSCFHRCQMARLKEAKKSGNILLLLTIGRETLKYHFFDPFHP